LLRHVCIKVAGGSVLSEYLINKARWRRFTGRASRQKRFQHRKSFKGSGKGTFGGKSSYGSPRFLCNGRSTYEDYSLVASAKGKGKGDKSGKGSGKLPRKNPIGADGKVMECSICSSDTHLRRYCPKAAQRSQGSNFPAAHLATQDQATSASAIDRSPAGALATMMSSMQPTQPPSWFKNALHDHGVASNAQVNLPQHNTYLVNSFATDQKSASALPVSTHFSLFKCWYRRCLSFKSANSDNPTG